MPHALVRPDSGSNALGYPLHVILDVMYARAPYTLIQRAMHIHPTVAELLRTGFGELQPA